MQSSTEWSGKFSQAPSAHSEVTRARMIQKEPYTTSVAYERRSWEFFGGISGSGNGTVCSR